MEEIVVGVDESQCAATALRWALKESHARGWTVTAVLAWGYLDQHHIDEGAAFDPHYGHAEALAALRAIVARAVGTESAAEVGTEALCDLAAPALIERSADASLLVVGSRGRGSFNALLLGSVSEACLQHTRVPIAIVHPIHEERTAPSERIVVGVDGSDNATLALRWAVAEGVASHATVVVVHAWHLPFTAAQVVDALTPDTGIFEEAARSVLDSAVATTDTAGLDAPIEKALVAKTPAAAILHCAKGADLIVLGSRGRGGFRGLLLGSVSHQVARHASCPVVVVPPLAKQ